MVGIEKRISAFSIPTTLAFPFFTFSARASFSAFQDGEPHLPGRHLLLISLAFPSSLTAVSSLLWNDFKASLRD